jgi:hypothetical protein
MNAKRKRQSEDSFFATEPAEVPTFGTGDAAEILEIPIWRLQKFLDSPQYNLSPMGKLGEGRGSRRVFTTEDLHRIALANRLVGDGFAPQFVGSVLRSIDDNKLNVYLNEQGEETELGLALFRGKGGPAIKIFVGSNARLKAQSNPPYYRVEFADVFGPVDERIERLKHPGKAS